MQTSDLDLGAVTEFTWRNSLRGMWELLSAPSRRLSTHRIRKGDGVFREAIDAVDANKRRL